MRRLSWSQTASANTSGGTRWRRQNAERLSLAIPPSRISASFSTGPAFVISNSYDQAKRPVSTTQDGRAVGYVYDKSGLRTELEWPDGFKVSYRYDDAGRLETLNQGAANDAAAPVLSSFGFDTLGRVSLQTSGTNPTFSAAYSYLPDDGLSDIAYDLPGTSDDLSFALAYTPDNLLLSKETSLDAFSYEEPFDQNQSYEANGLTVLLE